jgi:hypothetical protein
VDSRASPPPPEREGWFPSLPHQRGPFGPALQDSTASAPYRTPAVGQRGAPGAREGREAEGERAAPAREGVGQGHQGREGERAAGSGAERGARGAGGAIGGEREREGRA